MRLPNLFVIGGTKCGTSSLHSHLATHPQIGMTELKAPCYFVERAGRALSIQSPDGTEEGDLKLYLDLFTDFEGKAYAGESSDSYTKFPHFQGAPQRIRDFNPNARLMYILRDPIVRTVSHYWWRFRWENERRDIFTAVTEDSFYVNISNYALQLAQYTSVFDREQIKVVTLEELVAEPRRIFADIFNWLGVDSSFIPPNTGETENETPRVVSQPRFSALEQFRHSRLWEAVGGLVPKPIRQWGGKINARSVNRKEVDTRPVEDWLRPVLVEHTARLEDMLKRKFPLWKKLYEHAGAREVA